MNRGSTAVLGRRGLLGPVGWLWLRGISWIVVLIFAIVLAFVGEATAQAFPDAPAFQFVAKAAGALTLLLVYSTLVQLGEWRLLALGAGANLIPRSKSERHITAPLALVMWLLSVIVTLNPDVLRSIVVVAIHTPIWVWPLYALLLFLGLQRTLDSRVSVLRMLILPLVVAGLSIWSIIGAGMAGLPVMLAGLVLGSAIGWQLERDGATRRLGDGKMWLRGEWLSFVQIVVVLVFRYAINVIPFAAPTLNTNPIWHMSSLFLTAALSALFLGRTAARLKVYFAPIPATA